MVTHCLGEGTQMRPGPQLTVAHGDVGGHRPPTWMSFQVTGPIETDPMATAGSWAGWTAGAAGDCSGPG
ncbi:hypothetical protein CA984_38085, partial [Streptosporangium minutum]